jgi:peptidoglycan/LPS O-acetylase OafA/YrhL
MRLVKNAYLSVDFFFVLSGFVIAANYGRAIADGAALRDFMKRRFFRLYPLHFVVLMALVALEAVKFAARGAVSSEVAAFTGPNSPSLLVENLLMAQGLGIEDRLGWNPPSWSVSAEFVAYLLYGVAVLRGWLRGTRAFAGLSVLALLTYVAIASSQHTLDLTGFWGLARCFAGFALGVALQRFSPTAAQLAEPSRGARLAALSPFAALACLLALSFAQGAAVWIVVPLFVAMVATLQFDRGAVAALLDSAPMQFLGRVSYSIYLLHMPILHVATIALKRLPGVATHVGAHGMTLELASPWLGDLCFAGVVTGVLILARFTHAFIEEPGRKLGGARSSLRQFSVPARG